MNMRTLWNRFLATLPAHHEVTILMEGGHTIVVRCTGYSFTKQTDTQEYTKYNFTGLRNPNVDFGIRLDKMVGWTKVTRFGRP